ncbi:hypothetical protein PV326_008265 [Microctonus aethiopoides]|nr:hypothetical protein PV326_008265 [Microctonus aethiopoides]
MDLNGARRKNATRETTSTLKAWLNEHKKNPYPTKGEKIMLAIITKMTLTQVSTWFANARRRLKKENKMTWEPRNRVEDEDNNNDDDDSGRKSVDEKDRLDSKDSGTGSSEDGERPTNRMELLHGPGGATGSIQGRMESEWSESRADSGPDSPECLYDQREPPTHSLQLEHPAYLGSAHARLLRHPSPERTSPNRIGGGTTIHLPTPKSASSTGSGGESIKPRIWSLADMASKDGEQQSTNATIMGLSSPYGSTSGGGKIVSPLASRLPPHHPLHSTMHSSTQYVRPHPDFYRNFYGQASHLGTSDMAFLETYSRTLGGLSGVMPPTSLPGMLNTTSPLTSSGSNNINKPFTLNGNSEMVGPTVILTTTSGVSPSASSTASSIGSDQRSPHPNDGNHPPPPPPPPSSEIKSSGRV